MKHSAKKYAKALADTLSEKKVDESKISANFLKLLERNRDTKYADEIILLAEDLLLKKTGNKRIVLETARAMNNREALGAFVKKKKILEEKLNSNIITGGKIIVDGQKQLDFSLQNKLQKVFKLP